MSYQDWRHQWEYSSNWAVPRLVGAKGSIQVYDLGGTFYYFDNGYLSQIDQGQMAQRRLQIEVINR